MITDNLPVVIVYRDRNALLRFINKMGESWYDRKLEDMVGEHISEYLDPAAYEKIRGHLDKVFAGQAQNFDNTTTYPDGKTRHTTTAYIPHIGGDGQVLGYFGVIQDITERNDIERQLSQVQKMDAIGQLTGGIAHDFNNLLMVIDGYARRTLTNINDVEVAGRSLEEVLAATERATRLTKQLLAFSRRQIMERRVFRVAEAVTELKGLLAHTVGEQYEVEYAIADKKVCVATDSGELSQAILNLAINARDAMSPGGSLSIGVRVVESEAEFATIHRSLPPDRYVVISVTDNGAGIDDETLQHIFEPFFTTKDQGQGTGLGLAMVYGFAEQLGGAIDVATEVGKGTTFYIYLPVVERPAELIAAEEEQEYRGQGETILLVEDDDRLLELTHDVLCDLGYTVRIAANGLEALEIDDEMEDSFDLLLSDVVMPSLGGFELYDMLREKRSGLKAVFMSGYPARGGGKAEIPDNVPLLQKPVPTGQLARAIRVELDNPDFPKRA